MPNGEGADAGEWEISGHFGRICKGEGSLRGSRGLASRPLRLRRPDKM